MATQVILATHLSLRLLYFFYCLFKAIAHFWANGQLAFYKGVGFTVFSVFIEIWSIVHVGANVFP
ncbi:hypothetical protein D3C78_1763110 [compost metagenome]